MPETKSQRMLRLEKKKMKETSKPKRNLRTRQMRIQPDSEEQMMTTLTLKPSGTHPCLIRTLKTSFEPSLRSRMTTTKCFIVISTGNVVVKLVIPYDAHDEELIPKHLRSVKQHKQRDTLDL